jgi:hypothetical protein
VTDWELVRDLMNATIDACEAVEALRLSEQDRARSTGDAVTVSDVMISAWTYPENLRYAVIRARHDLQDDARYFPELARVLVSSAALCGELVGATRLDARTPTVMTRDGIRPAVRGMIDWYGSQMIPRLTHAAASPPPPTPSSQPS